MDFALFISLLVGWMLFHHGAWACVCRSKFYCSEYILLCPIPFVVRPGQPLGKVSITCTTKQSTDSLRVTRLTRFKDYSKQTEIASMIRQSGKTTPQYKNETEWKQRSTLEGNSTAMVLTVPNITFDDLQYKYMCLVNASRNDSTAYVFRSRGHMIYAIPEPRVTLNVSGIFHEYFLLNCSAFNRLSFSALTPGQIKFEYFNNGSWGHMPPRSYGMNTDIGRSAFSVRHSYTIRVWLYYLRGCHHRFRCYVDHHNVDHMEQYNAERLVDLHRGTTPCSASDGHKTAKAKSSNDGTKLYMDLTVAAAAAVIVAGVVAVLPVQS